MSTVCKWPNTIHTIHHTPHTPHTTIASIALNLNPHYAPCTTIASIALNPHYAPYTTIGSIALNPHYAPCQVWLARAHKAIGDDDAFDAAMDRATELSWENDDELM
jgi:hypothetical protein